MTDEEKFKVMKQTILSETEQKYGNELRQNYGDAIMADANKRLSDMSRETSDLFQGTKGFVLICRDSE